MSLVPYNREGAVSYARLFALSRNPHFYDFSGLGGDCTNFVSQCLYAGSGQMNYSHPLGWYYINSNRRSPSWTGVPYLYQYLTRKLGIGPIGQVVPISEVQPGDVSQFGNEEGLFYHSQCIVSVGAQPDFSNILVCAHTNDSLDRPLSTYHFAQIRFIHITGVVQ